MFDQPDASTSFCSSVQFKYRFSAGGRSWRLIRRRRACAELTAYPECTSSSSSENKWNMWDTNTSRWWWRWDCDENKPTTVWKCSEWRWSFTKMCWSYSRTKIPPTSFTVIKSAALRLWGLTCLKQQTWSLVWGLELRRNSSSSSSSSSLSCFLLCQLFPSLLFSFFSAGGCHGSVTQTLCFHPADLSVISSWNSSEQKRA